MFAAADPEHVTSIINYHSLKLLVSSLNKLFDLKLSISGNWVQDNQQLLSTVRPFLKGEWTPYELNTALWHLFERTQAPVNTNAPDESKPQTEKSSNTDEVSDLPVGTNTILYGPPGTGKTYHSVKAAVMAAEPGFSDDSNRQLIKDTYDRLVKEGRIRFVTFHQSYSYEEFVEGLRAETDDDGLVSYTIKSGIFKTICDDASDHSTNIRSSFDAALEKYKDFLEEQEDGIQLTTPTGKVFTAKYPGGGSFRAFPQQTGHEDIANGYRGYHVNTEHLRSFYRTGSRGGIYNLPYVRGVLADLQKRFNVPAYTDTTPQNSERKNFVLIIDEINRGNISKIFGELITLIEPSKRADQPEALYS